MTIDPQAVLRGYDAARERTGTTELEDQLATALRDVVEVRDGAYREIARETELRLRTERALAVAGAPVRRCLRCNEPLADLRTCPRCVGEALSGRAENELLVLVEQGRVAARILQRRAEEEHG